MLQGRVETAIFNYGYIQLQPGMCVLPKDNCSRKASPSPLQGKPHGPNKWAEAAPADSQCPLPSTKGLLRGNLSHTMFNSVPSVPKCNRKSLRCYGFEVDWETGQRRRVFLLVVKLLNHVSHIQFAWNRNVQTNAILCLSVNIPNFNTAFYLFKSFLSHWFKFFSADLN